jgi:DNA replication protein DnaC
VAGESPWPLVVIGPPGTGKTCAALCLLDYGGGVYFQAPVLAHEVVRAGHGQIHYPSGHPISPTQLWRHWRETHLFVLDEVGANSKVSDWHYEQVKRVLDEREGRPTVVLSNEPLPELTALYDDRVASRLAAGTVVQLEGGDRRIRP